MNNLLRNCLCFQLCSPECGFLYLLHSNLGAVLSDPVSVIDVNARLHDNQDKYYHLCIIKLLFSVSISKVLVENSIILLIY